jgi:hypothetical protein
MKYLIGSKALNFWTQKDNTKNDYDIVTDENINSDPSLQVDVSPTDLPLFTVCERYSSGKTLDTPVGEATIVNQVGLMLIKRSHLHRPLKFYKHIRDYHTLKKQVDVDDQYYELLNDLTAKTKEKYGDRTSKLNQNKKQFFDNYVTRIYDHDDLHRWTCYYDKPIFERLKSNSETVWCKKSKWDELSHEDKVKCVREEGFVIAIERFLLKDPKYPPKFAFLDAVEKICTTLCSGWFRDFAIENWEEILNHNHEFYEKFKSNVLKKELENEKRTN